jgi:AcrR family transcriptional regulator
MPAAGPAAQMQAVAREAKASMETLYRWYGDKTGLYAALVADNAVQIEAALIEAMAADPVAMLEDIGERLFDMVTSERAVALNRAAAADPSGVLGAAFSQRGRARIVPHLALVLAQISSAPPPELAGVFIDLLLGDIQIRRATGSAPVPSKGTGRTRATRAVAHLRQLYAGAEADPGLAGAPPSR